MPRIEAALYIPYNSSTAECHLKPDPEFLRYSHRMELMLNRPGSQGIYVVTKVWMNQGSFITASIVSLSAFVKPLPTQKMPNTGGSLVD